MNRFLDTYALIGLLNGDSSHRDLRTARGLTGEMNVLETLVKLLRRGDKNPRATFDALGVAVVPFMDSDLITAAVLKADPSLRARNLSYIDALGYVMARRMGLAFRTGDPGFLELPGVEFVQ